ncbi:hypothetical protein CI610_02184 [invertebrate metagenome]|uniref:Uncharacterized protein n=1 Tax=invertebrate metagenome TaxID=1711999 RepID=A0A2H9T6L4_9ZZZZ
MGQVDSVWQHNPDDLFFFIDSTMIPDDTKKQLMVRMGEILSTLKIVANTQGYSLHQNIHSSANIDALTEEEKDTNLSLYVLHWGNYSGPLAREHITARSNNTYLTLSAVIVEKKQVLTASIEFPYKKNYLIDLSTNLDMSDTSDPPTLNSPRNRIFIPISLAGSPQVVPNTPSPTEHPMTRRSTSRPSTPIPLTFPRLTPALPTQLHPYPISAYMISTYPDVTKTSVSQYNFYASLPNFLNEEQKKYISLIQIIFNGLIGGCFQTYTKVTKYSHSVKLDQLDHLGKSLKKNLRETRITIHIRYCGDKKTGIAQIQTDLPVSLQQNNLTGIDFFLTNGSPYLTWHRFNSII